jgi:hypothetical protein
MKHYDMDDLSLSLSFIGSGQRKIKQQIISQLTYKEIIEIVTEALFSISPSQIHQAQISSIQSVLSSTCKIQL